MAGFFDDLGFDGIETGDTYAGTGTEGYSDAVEPEVTFPVITDSPQTPSAGGYSGTIQNLLGSVGSVIQNAPQIGASLGTAVGTAKHNVQQGVANYSSAQSAASSGNSLGVWWANASTTDKLMIGLAIIGIIVAVEK